MISTNDSRWTYSKCESTPRDSVANVYQIFTVDKTFLVERIGSLPEHLQEEIDEGLRTILYL
ncbi:MAG: type II toxin-antitoxin system PemK/MazF family toxin [Nostoc sp.]